MPITVDHEFLTRLADVMRDISGQAPIAANGEIDNMSLHLGTQNFTPGQQLFNAIWQRGRDIHARLGEIGTAAGNRSAELRLFLRMTDDLEDGAQMTAEQFASQLPLWSSGGLGGGAGTATD